MYYYYNSPTPTLMAFTGVTNAHGPSPRLSQQHVDLHYAVWQPQQEVTRPKAMLEPFLWYICLYKNKFYDLGFEHWVVGVCWKRLLCQL